MKLEDLVPDFSKMSDEELKHHIHHIRHEKYIAKPAKAKRAQEVEKKVTRKRVSTVDKMLDGMSEEDRLKLIQLLGG